jgi:AcrR family transcriptional regulator
MARPVDQARRDKLLAQAVDHVCAHGLAGLSLRSLAAALHVDASLLTHHFGSKQQMLALVLNGVRDRLRAVGAITAGESLPEALHRVWGWASDPARRELYLLFFEVYALALRSPEEYEPFLRTVVEDWLGPLTRAYQHDGHDEQAAQARATLAIATLRGLLLDLLTTGDSERINRALAQAEQVLA